ncbi:hypothetical protein [Halomonas sp. AOP42-B2-16]|uniref:hypothetical protein n=1 Tax=Halomonas sp. AOP42-B2-16 TaxID=3457673 RepID=UPI004033D075
MAEFNAEKELKKIRELRQRRRLPRYWRGHSQLDKHSAKLLALHDGGGSANDLRIWLEEQHKLSVNRSTVCRWLQKATAQRRAQAERHQ